jgi:peptidoglycan hydrolase-like protein with peptidoglycan-binding domain
MAERAYRAQHPESANSPVRPRPRAPEHPLATLQRQAGNRAVTSLVNGFAGLKEGDGPSRAIGVIQQQLNAVRSPIRPRLAITGRFDAETRKATKAFQRRLIAEVVTGVAANGVVDGVTLRELNSRARSVRISGSDTVVVGPGNTPRSWQTRKPASTKR